MRVWKLNHNVTHMRLGRCRISTCHSKFIGLGMSDVIKDPHLVQTGLPNPMCPRWILVLGESPLFNLSYLISYERFLFILYESDC